MREKRRQLHHPVAPLVVGDAHASAALDGDWSERMIDSERDYQLHRHLLDGVAGDHFARHRPRLHLTATTNALLNETGETKAAGG